MSKWFPPPSRPRAVEGGIRARSKRGVIAQTWWSERFIAVLESIGIGSRLDRGRNYARAGQVVEFTVAPGAVTALVQGSRAKPYRVRIGVTAFDKTEWNQVSQALADNAWYTAKLLAGEMPEDIEDVFTSVGLSLFPTTARDLSMDCSCPDWEVPCKHLAAVFYLLAESFDTDPFAILGWRGRDRAELLATVNARRSGGRPVADYTERDGAVVPLADVMHTYYSVQGTIPLRGPAQTRSDSLLDQLPATSLVIRDKNIVELLRPAYVTLGDDRQ